MKRMTLSGEQQIQARFGTSRRPEAFYANQRLDYLNAAMQAFIARQDMVSIATAGGDGRCDCSFRSGEPGFVHVLDTKTLVYPEYRGNGVFASLANIVENAHIVMLFVDYSQTTVGLHVNGRARLIESSALLTLPQAASTLKRAAETSGGLRAEVWVLVEVQEAYIHYSKHVPLMKRLDKQMAWGTDDEVIKGGDFFKVSTRTYPAPQEESSMPPITAQITARSTDS